VIPAGKAIETISTCQAQLNIPPEPKYEQVVLASTEKIARRMGFSRSRIDDIRSAVSEAVMNAIEHGRPAGGGARGEEPGIFIRFLKGETGLIVEIRDDGQGFDPESIARPKIDEKLAPGSSRRGWGLYLIYQLADEVEIRMSPGQGNLVRLFFYREQIKKSS
jgi:serine/threonine-protein kinase RsbW